MCVGHETTVIMKSDTCGNALYLPPQKHFKQTILIGMTTEESTVWVYLTVACSLRGHCL